MSHACPGVPPCPECKRIPLWWRIANWLGKHGWFTYNGLRGMQPRWWPQAYVEYTDMQECGPGPHCTHDMAIGNAWGYARIGKSPGIVHKPGTGPRDVTGAILTTPQDHNSHVTS